MHVQYYVYLIIDLFVNTDAYLVYPAFLTCFA